MSEESIVRGGGLLRIVSLLVIVWLIVGVVAVVQRGYLTRSNQTCASAATIAVTVLAGPTNYFGVNPAVADCAVPQPSS